MFTNTSVKKAVKEIGPRFAKKNVFAGFTKIESIGRRTPDGAEMALIEIIGNPIQEWEKVQDKQAHKKLSGSGFWAWELKLLRQEQQHFKDHLDKLQDKIDEEIDSFLGEQAAAEDQTADLNEQVKKEIENKYSK